jgi:DNA integrity scanning protein DisA with diadenylate cyclase activity
MNVANELIIKSAMQVAQKSRATAILIYADALDDLIYNHPVPRSLHIVMVTKKKRTDYDDDPRNSLGKRSRAIITVPKIPTTRLGLIKLALILGTSQGIITPGEQVVCVVGKDEQNLDCFQIVNTSRETELFTSQAAGDIHESIPPAIFQAILNICMELSSKGREGKPVGTIFVVGDDEKVMQLSKQMIINPFKGYDDDERNILNPSLKETIREFSGLDGAFVVGADGTVMTAGRYLGATAEVGALPQGLGSRHIAAAGITALTKAVAFVISESSGDVRIFKDGKVLMEVEKVSSRR